MFKTIAEKVGTDLTIENWQKTVDAFGTIDLVPTDIASLCKGKYAADDAFRLVEFDSTLGETGDWTAAHRGRGRERRQVQLSVRVAAPRRGLARGVRASRCCAGSRVRRCRGTTTTTRGFVRTSSGAPSTMTWPASRQ